MASDGVMKRRWAGTAAALLLVAALAAGVRFGYLAGFEDSPFADTPLGRSAMNLNMGRAMAASGVPDDEPYPTPPLYPLAISVAAETGEEIPLVRRAQAIAGVLVACLCFLGGRMLLGTAGGLLAGLLAALYGPSFYYESRLLPAVFMTLLFTCYWLVAVLAWRRRSAPLWLLAGLFLGAMAAMETGALVLFVPALVLYLSKHKPGASGGSIAALPLVIVGAAIVLAPFIAHNVMAGAPGVGVAADCGTEFYVANNPDATGLPPSVAGEDSWWFGERYAATEAETETGREMGPGAVSRHWFSKGLQYMARHPLSYLKLVVRKLGHFWSGREIALGPSPSFVSANWAPWSGPLMHAFAALGALTLAGVFTLRRKPYAPAAFFPLIGALVLAVAYTAESSVRLPALPSLAVVSGAFLTELARALRDRRTRAVTFSIVSLAVAALVVGLLAPWLSGLSPSPAKDHRLMGVVYEAQGKGSIALSEYDRAVKLDPKDAAGRLSIAAMLASDGVADEAEKHFLVAAALDTLSPRPHVGLANLYRRNGLYEQALYSLQAARAKAPHDLGLLISLGRNCVDMGLYEQAEMYFKEALRMDPENIAAIDGLLELKDRGVMLKVGEEEGDPATTKDKIRRAIELLRQGDMETSRALLDQAEEAAPDDINVTFAGATWHLANGDFESAIDGYEKCLEANPKNVIVMNNLAAAYKETGRVDEAVALWKKILSVDPSNLKAKSNLRRTERQRSEGQ